MRPDQPPARAYNIRMKNIRTRDILEKKNRWSKSRPKEIKYDYVVRQHTLI